ncbi:MAG: type I-E CRISPR-associated protein Cas7/Cse4/CasC [Acidimicrobiaceae bacterium]|nr:type I-E CRISPR-associated protein Cas7/Cse4/CasC [Acidimicrobiia bacterium]MCY4492925.1 type I-E CRISPR-associated protein Cas7/Cse4/CasC [Acidimicrobiaceae bacterium]
MAEINNAFLDVHILHGVPFSNLNRDNIGTPKSMLFGGATRSRISSQCTKRAARLWLEDNTEMGKALRTRRLPQAVRETLTGGFAFDDGDAVKAVTVLFGMAGIKLKVVNSTDDDSDDAVGTDGELQGDQLTFTTSEAARDIAAVVAKHRDAILADEFKPNKALKDELLGGFHRQNTVIALCGRMLADLPGSNVDGALQVAHAFTTHASSPDLDYFTAVDDEVQDEADETGAGHINVNEFTSGVFYRHATVGLGLLAESFDGSAVATAEAASAFVRAFMLAEPTGKQNTANAHTRPEFIAVTLRAARPVSLASAFEAPVESGKRGGFMAESVARLGEHAAATNAFYGDDDIIGAWYAVASSDLAHLPGLGSQIDNFGSLIGTVEQAVEAAVS